MWQKLAWPGEVEAEIQALKAVFGEDHVKENIKEAKIFAANLDPLLYDPRSVISDEDDWKLVERSPQMHALNPTFCVTVDVPKDYPSISPCHFKVSKVLTDISS
eukprot:Gregarina_sp_Poly_1__9109@NODE_558_length_7531_cov_98_785102_g439_i0_p11_GENE_NODE_558_length_7531_cov_98_785102_g439_i0NODE_558_length_7531_cov_98_785102_g439_i0_p11_ORF_typecomplete_len104_score19_24RWD/PF05773_22/4_3e05_NODE_558_length_7531_cov_98_785102_g439_i048025113